MSIVLRLNSDYSSAHVNQCMDLTQRQLKLMVDRALAPYNKCDNRSFAHV